MIKVQALSQEQLESHASGLLAEYAETVDGPVVPPIPVADIAMHHLALRLECGEPRRE